MGLIVSRLLSSIGHRMMGSIWSLGLLALRPPARLVIAPPDIRTADPTVAADIYAGYFVFDSKPVNTHGRSPFAVPAPSLAWAEALADFGWLRHLRAADTSLARVNARALVGDWISQVGKSRRGPAWAPKIASRRILAWLSQSPIILEGVDSVFYRKFMLSLGRHAAFLRWAILNGLTGEARLFAAIALTELGLCAEGYGKQLRVGTRILLEELGTQILPDGGHISRDPALPIDLLLFLLPLRQAFVAAGVPVPTPLLNAIDRMMPMVRTFRHGDGALALFNGMGITRPEALATVLAYDDIRGQALSNAPYSGYQRLEAGEAVVVIDAGVPPPVDFSRKAHAGTLAFEFSAGMQQIIVNCGAPNAGSPALRQMARATAAHSTLVLADRSSSRFLARGRFRQGLEGLVYAGPAHVPVNRSEQDGDIVIEASHDGYLAGFGLLHRRRLILTASGHSLVGEDHLEPKGTRRRKARDQPFVLRFHIHPTLLLRPIRNDTAVLIAGSTGELWIFEAGGLPLKIEDSIYFASADGARRIEQIVVLGQSRERPGIAWSLSLQASG